MVFQERLLDEAKRMTQDALKDTSGWRMRTGQDDSVGQEGQWTLQDEVSHRGGVSRKQ